MLRVNLIGQRIQELRQKRTAMLTGMAISLAFLLGAAGVVMWTAGSWVSQTHRKARLQPEISQNQADAERVQRIKDQAEVLKPIAELAEDVQITADRWGVFVRDVTAALPRHKGWWLNSIETSFDDQTYRQVVVMRGYAEEQKRVGDFAKEISRLPDTFDPWSVTVPSSELQADDKEQTQRVAFTVESNMASPIGVSYQ